MTILMLLASALLIGNVLAALVNNLPFLGLRCTTIDGFNHAMTAIFTGIFFLGAAGTLVVAGIYSADLSQPAWATGFILLALGVGWAILAESFHRKKRKPFWQHLFIANWLSNKLFLLVVWIADGFSRFFK